MTDQKNDQNAVQIPAKQEYLNSLRGTCFTSNAGFWLWIRFQSESEKKSESNPKKAMKVLTESSKSARQKKKNVWLVFPKENDWIPCNWESKQKRKTWTTKYVLCIEIIEEKEDSLNFTWNREWETEKAMALETKKHDETVWKKIVFQVNFMVLIRKGIRFWNTGTTAAKHPSLHLPDKISRFVWKKIIFTSNLLFPDRLSEHFWIKILRKRETKNQKSRVLFEEKHKRKTLRLKSRETANETSAKKKQTVDSQVA